MKLFISGYTGKMGQETEKAIEHEPDITLVGKSRRGDKLEVLLKETNPDVMVDFTHPSVVFQHIVIALQAGVVPVVGTTGLTDDHLQEIQALSSQYNRGVIVCPNFAIGAILMMRFASEAAKYMPRVEILEFHHDKKADAPSGTAIKTADMIYTTNGSINAHQPTEIESISGARGGARHRIPIHSVRLPGFVASQEVIFGGVGQTLSIRHDTLSRDSFMPGVILAIRKAKQTTGLLYGLEKLL